MIDNAIFSAITRQNSTQKNLTEHHETNTSLKNIMRGPL